MFTTGKSLELLGMASFNVFLGLVLTTTFLNQNSDSSPRRLTEASVTHFVTEMTDVALGKKADLDQYGMTTWLMKHLDENISVTTNMNITDQNGMAREESLQMGRMDYISHILKDNKAVKDRQATLHIEYIKVEEGGQDASVIFTSQEKANVPMASEGGDYVMPISGTAYCEQKLALREAIITVSASHCTMNVSMSESY